MDDYHFGADLLDTFQSAPDAIKALIVLSGPIILLGMAALLLHHLRGCRQIERDHEDLREARWIQRERWLQSGGDPDFHRRLQEAFDPRAPGRLPDHLAESRDRIVSACSANGRRMGRRRVSASAPPPTGGEGLTEGGVAIALLPVGTGPEARVLGVMRRSNRRNERLIDADQAHHAHGKRQADCRQDRRRC